MGHEVRRDDSHVDLVLWLLAALVAVFFALQWLPAAFDGHTYFPVGHDSFYHAERILDAVRTGRVIQFDPRIHAPEGSLLTWPWAYDLAMAWLARGLLSMGVIDEPMAALIYVPVLFTCVAAGLLVIVTRQLTLPFELRIFALACFAFSPLTQSLHGAGMLDHHYIEYAFVLGVLAAGIGWAQKPDAVSRAFLLGALLGGATAFHNSLFVLQVPLLIALGLYWLRAGVFSARAIQALAGALVVTQLLAAWPSLAFQRGQFDYYTLSWFHVFVATISACIMLFLQRVQCSRVALGGLLLGLTLLALVVQHQLFAGVSWLTSQVVNLDRIIETQSLLNAWRLDGIANLLSLYSALILALPAVVVLSVVMLFRARNLPLIFFYAMVCAGGVLMFSQLRLHYFGSFALYLPLLVWSSRYWRHIVGLRPRGARIVLAAAFAAIHMPVYERLFALRPIAGDREYDVVRALYPAFARQCAERPGIVLADPNDGHHITFHTGCSVIANMMIITPQHEEKMRLVDRLMTGRLADIRSQAPYVRYVFVWDDRPFWPAAMRPREPRSGALTTEVLGLSPVQADAAHVRLVVELSTPGPQPEIFARVIEILD